MLKFVKDGGEGVVYVNPQTVEAIESPIGDTVVIKLVSGAYYRVKGTLDDVSSQVTNYNLRIAGLV